MKNNANVLLAKQLELLRKKTRELVPEIYASFCNVLISRYNWTPDQIAELFAATQEEWQKIVDNDDVENMVALCEQLTGVCLREGEVNG